MGLQGPALHLGWQAGSVLQSVAQLRYGSARAVSEALAAPQLQMRVQGQEPGGHWGKWFAARCVLTGVCILAGRVQQ